MTEKLEDCPFCGGDAEMYYPFHLMGRPGSPATYNAGVQCKDCRCKASATNPPEQAIATWNRRAAPRAMGASADERAEFVKQLRSKASMARMAASEIEADYEPDDPADIAAGLEFDAEMNEKAADLIEALLAQPEPSREVEDVAAVAYTKSAVQAFNEARSQALNVDWYTWQIAWKYAKG
ncbi:hypothetical protein D3C72_1391720 [compost metagenome]